MQNCKVSQANKLTDATSYQTFYECKVSNHITNETHRAVALGGIADLPEMESCITLYIQCVIHSHILGLLRIPSLKNVIGANVLFPVNHNTEELLAKSKFRNALHIINKHLKGDRDILACQEELIENGFKEYAKL